MYVINIYCALSEQQMLTCIVQAEVTPLIMYRYRVTINMINTIEMKQKAWISEYMY